MLGKNAPESIPNHLSMSLYRRYITGCISYMPLIVIVNTTAECLRTDCNILGDKIKKGKHAYQSTTDIKAFIGILSEKEQGYHVLLVTVYWEMTCL